MSKGSKRRPATVTADEIRRQWDKAFPNAAPMPRYVTRNWYVKMLLTP